MIINRSCLKEFAEKLHSLPSSLTKSDLLTDPFRLHQENELAIYYSPHNEFINRDASLVIAGITPGFFQMKTAYETAAESLLQGGTLEQMAVDTKIAAGFFGSMRHNLITMLDLCGLPLAFGICSIQLPLLNILSLSSKKTIPDTNRPSLALLS